jgi:hypothetical protein
MMRKLLVILLFVFVATTNADAKPKGELYTCRVISVLENTTSKSEKWVSKLENDNIKDTIILDLVNNFDKNQPSQLMIYHIEPEPKGKTWKRHEQYATGSYTLTSFSEDSNSYTFHGSRIVGSTVYRVVGELKLGDEYDKKYPYNEKIFKNGQMDADINALCEKGFLNF